MVMDTGMRNRGRDAMRRILEAASYTVQDMEDPLALSALGRDECVIVLISDDATEIEQFDGMNFRLQDDDRHVTCKKLLVALADGMKTKSCIVWGRDEFVRYAGAAALASITGQGLRVTLEAPDSQQPGTEGLASGTEAETGPDIMHLPIKIDPARAVRIAGIEGAAKLRFIPHWRYHLVSNGEKIFKDKLISFEADTWGAINAVNGMEMEMPMDSAEVSGVPADAEIVHPRNEKKEAEEKIVVGVIDKLTQRLRVRTEKGDAIFYEEKVFKPERKDIRVDIDLVYVPIWQVRGKKIIEVNGFTGDILSMPMDEGVELL
jgi:hypothetical protein